MGKVGEVWRMKWRARSIPRVWGKIKDASLRASGSTWMGINMPVSIVKARFRKPKMEETCLN